LKLPVLSRHRFGTALGRSRGGYGTKACAVCDARGRPLGFALIPAQASELRVAPDLLLLAALLGIIRRVVCDAAYSSTAWCALMMEAGAVPVVRSNPTHSQQEHFDRAAYHRRHGDTATQGRKHVGQAGGMARHRHPLR
jgi:transposase